MQRRRPRAGIYDVQSDRADAPARLDLLAQMSSPADLRLLVVISTIHDCYCRNLYSRKIRRQNLFLEHAHCGSSHELCRPAAGARPHPAVLGGALLPLRVSGHFDCAARAGRRSGIRVLCAGSGSRVGLSTSLAARSVRRAPSSSSQCWKLLSTPRFRSASPGPTSGG